LPDGRHGRDSLNHQRACGRREHDDRSVAGAATSLRTYRSANANVVVADPAMARLYALVERLARVDLPVLITGGDR